MGEIKFSGSVSLEEPSSLGYFLWRLGHFHNPAHPTGIDPTEPDEALSLELRSPKMEAGIMSYMEWFEQDLDELVQAIHDGRHLSKDGHAGPAFEQFANLPRCGYPDYMAAGRQEANWPTACRGNLKTGRDFDALPGSTKEKTDGIWWASANNWTWALEDVSITSAAVNDSRVQVYADLRRLSGSTLAWSYLAQNNCNVRLQQAYNTRTNWAKDDFGATVKSHEDGHAWGLPHNNDRDALMYPQIHPRSVARHGYPNATDLRVAKGLGYRLSDKTGPPPREWLYKPRPWDDGPDPEPKPDPEPPTGGVILKGTTTVYIDGEAVGDFIFTPKTAV